MNRIQIMIATFVSVTVSGGASAQAQVYLGSGVSFGIESMGNIASAPGNTFNLGTSSTTGLVSNLPLMVSLGPNTTAEISFSGSSGLYNGSIKDVLAAPSAMTTNYLAARGGAVTMDFNTEQRYFSTIWGTVDSANSLSFYNNDTLIKTVSGSSVWTAHNVAAGGTYNVEFQFADLGYDRVVASSSIAFEFAPISVSTEAIDVAPIPLNAASLGGLLSFLMMLGMRGKGGPQVAIRMAFASIMPRRRGMA